MKTFKDMTSQITDSRTFRCLAIVPKVQLDRFLSMEFPIPSYWNFSSLYLATIPLTRYKSIHNQTPNYIQEMFSLRSNGYSLRGHLKVVLPRPTSSYMQHSFTYQASKQWNNLTDKIRMSESLSIFR